MPESREAVNPDRPLALARLRRYAIEMEVVGRFVTPLSRCGYLPDEQWRLEYEFVSAMTSEEYAVRMQEGWRRFGHALFRPQCPACGKCQSLRVPASEFLPSRSQRRTFAANEGCIELKIGPPQVTKEKLRLYDRFHAFQSELKGWPLHSPKDPESYADSFVENPYPIEEWRYHLGRRLVGVGYVDPLAVGLSAIYYFYDPELRGRGLGVYNVLKVIEAARRRGLPHAYLGYFVAGCPSLEYKAAYRPNEIRHADGVWRTFRPAPRS